ncbi:MAG: hypothetical protein ACLP6E_19790 [Acidimicrobiales bacterium]
MGGAVCTNVVGGAVEGVATGSGGSVVVVDRAVVEGVAIVE